MKTRRGVAGRLLALGVGVAAVVADGSSALSADLADPLSPLLSASEPMLCFGRNYSPEYLAQHPKQMTKSVLLAFQSWSQDSRDLQRRVTVVLTPRAGVPRQAPAGCYWAQEAGSGPSGKMFPNFDKHAGFDCVVPVGTTDEEGGALLIDPARDATSLTLFLQSPISVANGKPGEAKPYFLRLDPEDSTFALTRIEPKACASRI